MDPHSAYYYHQNPSTSWQPQIPQPSTSWPYQQQQRQVFGTLQQPIPHRAMARVRNQEYTDSWINPYGTSNSYSPTPSECGSNMSLNTVVSRMSNLSINTYVHDVHLTYHSGTSNTQAEFYNPPMTIESIIWHHENVVSMLRRSNLLECKEHLQAFYNQFTWLLVGLLINTDANEIRKGRDNLPFKQLPMEKQVLLIRELFNQLHHLHSKDMRENYGNKSEWADAVSRLVKNLVQIMFIHNESFDETLKTMFRSLEKCEEGAKYPLAIFPELLLHSKGFNYRNVVAVKILIFSPFQNKPLQGVPRYRRHIVDLSKDSELFKRLLLIVFPSEESMDWKAKAQTMEFVVKLMNRKETKLRWEFLNYKVIRPWLARYFHLKAEEGLIYQTTVLLNRIIPARQGHLPEIVPGVEFREDETFAIYREFLRQFIEGNGFTHITQMLTHGSPRVLTGCLKFLAQISNEIVVLKPCDLSATIIGVLSLMGSQEILVVHYALQFLFNIVSNNCKYKELLIEKSAVKHIIHASMGPFPNSIDRSVDIQMHMNLSKEIRENGIGLLKKLLSENQLALKAAEQIFLCGDNFVMCALENVLCRFAT